MICSEDDGELDDLRASPTSGYSHPFDVSHPSSE